MLHTIARRGKARFFSNFYEPRKLPKGDGNFRAQGIPNTLARQVCAQSVVIEKLRFAHGPGDPSTLDCPRPILKRRLIGVDTFGEAAAGIELKCGHPRK